MDFNMFHGHFSGPMMVDNGAVRTGAGKFRIHFLGSSNPKELTGRVIMIAVAVVLAVLAITTLLAGKEPKDFPNEIEMLNAIGQPLETATMKMGVPAANLTEKEPGVYFANQGIILDGVAFDLYFYEDAGRLSGFAYIADYQADAKKAAKDIYNALVNLRIESFDKYPYYLYREDNVTYEVTRKNLRNHLENEGSFLLVKHTFNLTPTNSADPIKAYMDALEAAEDWEGNKIRKAVLYMDKGAAYDPETQRVQVVYSYRIEPEREGKYQ